MRSTVGLILRQDLAECLLLNYCKSSVHPLLSHQGLNHDDCEFAKCVLVDNDARHNLFTRIQHKVSQQTCEHWHCAPTKTWEVDNTGTTAPNNSLVVQRRDLGPNHHLLQNPELDGGRVLGFLGDGLHGADVVLIAIAPETGR